MMRGRGWKREKMFAGTGGEAERMKWAGSWWLNAVESNQTVSRTLLIKKPLPMESFLTACLDGEMQSLHCCL